MPDPITGLIGSTVISAGAGLFGASQQAGAAADATAAQTAANDKNIEFQKAIFEDQKAALKPWQDFGMEALKTMQTKYQNGDFDLSGFGMEELANDPGYQLRLKEGQNALDTAATARGKFISSDQMKDLSRYSQEFAANEFGAAYGRAASERDTQFNILNDMAGKGYGAASALSGVSADLGSKVGTSLINQGNAAANGALQQGNAWANFGAGLAQTGNQGISNFLLAQQLGML